jgi:NAD(P)-dependent dehydrogenase (short-subunit alcohol dehydrogenase family)
MNLGIAGRVVAVTGGSSGMGLSTAEFLLQEGANPRVDSGSVASF